MLVSIIVPIYNAECFLSACIESIIGQSYGDFELILVNDGSTDASLTICHQYSQRDTRIIVLDKVNGGSASAKNAGIEIAKGEFIEFVDADDVIDETYLENMVAGINDEVDLCVGNVCFVTKKEEILSERYVDMVAGFFSLRDFLSFYPKYMPKAIIGAPWNKLYRASIIKKQALEFDVSLKNNEDTQFNYAYLPHCRNVFVSTQPYYRYINRGCSASTRYIPNLFDIYVSTYIKAKEFLRKTDTYSVNISFQNEYFLSLVVGAVNSIVNGANNLSFREKCAAIRIICAHKEVRFALAEAKLKDRKRRFISELMKRKLVFLIYLCFYVHKK